MLPLEPPGLPCVALSVEIHPFAEERRLECLKDEFQAFFSLSGPPKVTTHTHAHVCQQHTDDPRACISHQDLLLSSRQKHTVASLLSTLWHLAAASNATYSNTRSWLPSQSWSSHSAFTLADVKKKLGLIPDHFLILNPYVHNILSISASRYSLKVRVSINTHHHHCNASHVRLSAGLLQCLLVTQDGL